MIVQTQQGNNSFGFLPEDVWQIMLSPKTIEFNKKLIEKYKLSPEDGREMVILEENVFRKNIPPYAFSKMLAEKTKIDLKTAQKISEEITQKLFLPIKDYLGPLTGPLLKPKPKISEEQTEIKPEEKKEIVEKPKEETEKEKEIKISPYEQKRETPIIKPETEKEETKEEEKEKIEIPTFPKIPEKPKPFSISKPATRIIKEEKKDEEQKKAKELEKKYLLKKGDYKIRTMKEDVKKVKEGLSSSKQ